MDCWVYILECGDGLFYTEITADLLRRWQAHISGKTPFTKHRKPLKLVYKEKLSTREEAAKREKEIKGWNRNKKIKLIESSSH